MNIHSLLFNNLTVLCLSLSLTTLNAQIPLVIGIAGGSGSGKTTLAQKLHALFPDSSVIISQDSYYDLSATPLEERGNANFDHPESLDFDLLEKHLKALRSGDSIEVPHYDFTTHSRTEETTAINCFN